MATKKDTTPEDLADLNERIANEAAAATTAAARNPQPAASKSDT